MITQCSLQGETHWCKIPSGINKTKVNQKINVDPETPRDKRVLNRQTKINNNKQV